VDALMPELPEVEILVRQLAPRLRGRAVTAVETRDRKLRLPATLVGRRIRDVTRRDKHIIISSIDDDRRLLVHLRMTGWIEFAPPARHRLRLDTDAGSVYFEDTRRLGVVEVVSAGTLRRRLERLGAEPLARNFDVRVVTRTARAIKVALLDQSLIAGLGNIYASESLWRARIDPRRPACRLGDDELQRLQRSIIAALRKAVAYGPRIFQVQRFAVYERDGKPCRRCGARIRRIVQAQRSTYFCPRCQRKAELTCNSRGWRRK
jgi:formamidopyrimidine-DNA glycosylase